MKVLFWVSPITEMSWPFQKMCWLQSFVPRTLEQLRKLFPVDETVLCVSGDLYRHAQKLGCSLEGRVVTFGQEELLDDFSYDALKERKRYQATGEFTPFYRHLEEVYMSKVGTVFMPNIIISFNESPFLRRRFPDAAHLTIELSVFSRQPYPELFAFDPLSDGNGCRFTTAKYAGLINEFPASQEERDALARFRQVIARSLMSNACIGNYFAKLRERYEHILLMPLGYENYFDTLVTRPYSGQFEFVEHALSSIGQNTCLILTQHPTIHAIRPERIEELKEIYPNLVSEDWYGSVSCFSQVAIAYADGCIVGGSSLAYQAAFLGKYLISPDGFCAGISDATDFSSIEQVFDKDPLCRDNYFAWTLRHLAVEMTDAWRFFNGILPEHKKWGSLSAEAILKSWPAVLSTAEFVEKLRKWELGPVADFHNQFAGIVPFPDTRDGSSMTLKIERDAAIADRDAIAADRDAIAAERDAVAADRDAIAADRDAIAANRDAIAAERDAIAADRDAIAADRDAVAADRDAIAANRDAVAADRDRLAAERRIFQCQLWQILASEPYKLQVKVFKVVDSLFPKDSCRRNRLKRIYYAAKRAYKRLRNREGNHDSAQACYAAIALADESKSIKVFEKLTIPECKNPVVSIVVPVYNQFEYTYCCIRSVISNSGDVPYEIILADDCSTDQTINAVRYVKNIRVARTPQNMRFLKNCNNAARDAKGKYILFLNNDTLVHANWLKPLVDLCEGDKTIGVTGSKLVYSAGVLQEAGGILWQDGSAWNFGQGKNPLDSEYCYVKECDYISGAALMVRKSLWDEVGGFDETFAPAYYEDTDFCFEARKHGYRVVLQPQSVVTHFEGRSNGTDVTSGLKKYQVENQRKFYEKWKDVLCEHAPNGVDVFTARDRSQKKQHVFLVDHYIPTFDKDAGGRQIYFYLKTLSEMGFQVHLLGDNCTHEEPYTSTFQQMGIEVLYGERFHPMNRETWFRENGRFLDFAFLHRPHIAVNYVGLVRSTTKAKIIFFGADVGQVRIKREYDLKKTPELLAELDAVKRQEDFLYESSDVNLCVGSGDAGFVAKHYPTHPVFNIPLFIYDKFREEAPSFKRRSGVMFVGGFGHHPNVDAVLWFVKEIWPTVLKACPGIKFHIVGSKAPEKILSLASDSVVVEGFMPDEDLLSLYDKCRLTVAPLRYGAGVKGKIIDAMYFRSVVVTTSIGAEGIPQKPKPFPVVDDAKSFAAEVIRLHADENCWQSYQKASLEMIKKTYSLDVARKLLAEIFVKG